jgi:hypothetical protein
VDCGGQWKQSIVIYRDRDEANNILITKNLAFLFTPSKQGTNIPHIFEMDRIFCKQQQNFEIQKWNRNQRDIIDCLPFESLQVLEGGAEI